VIGIYRYIVYVERAKYDWNGQGVVVLKTNAISAHFPCTETPDPDKLYELKGVSIPAIDQSVPNFPLE
jgi:hypothetical protein